MKMKFQFSSIEFRISISNLQDSFFTYKKKKKRNNSIVFLTNSSKPVPRLRYSLDKEKILIPLVIIPINPVIIHRL